MKILKIVGLAIVGTGAAYLTIICPKGLICSKSSTHLTEKETLELLSSKEFLIRKQNDHADFRILENVRLSGSAQYSKNSLEKIIQEIKQHQKDNSPIAIIDVRQEMHLLGGSALSDVIAEKDWSEINHKIESILNDENKLVQPGLMEREETVAKSLNLNYLRLLVTDDSIPNEKALDLFVKFFKEQIEKNPKVWFHVHCEHGHGRTTTFMTLVHILNTNGQVKLGEILKEQYDHGKVDLSFPTMDQQKIKDVDLQRTRFAFLEEFHQYVNDKESGFYTGKSWSDWKKSVSE